MVQFSRAIDFISICWILSFAFAIINFRRKFVFIVVTVILYISDIFFANDIYIANDSCELYEYFCNKN